VRASLLLCIFAIGCATDPSPPTMPEPLLHIDVDALSAPVIKDTGKDICGLAAQLPAGDICAMMCDPDAMKAQLLAEGTPAGTCYEFSCALPDDSRVIVGVCLPPPT
jgi:hypothetical protein